MKRLLSPVVLLIVVGCSDSHGPRDAPPRDVPPPPPGYDWEPRCETPVPGRGATVCSAPCTSEPISDGTTTGRRSNCCNPNPPELARASWWVSEPPGACLETPRTTPARTQPHWGDRCESSTSGYNELACGGPPQVVCRPATAEQLRWDPVLMDWWVEGALTSMCRTSGDCPSGTVCVDAGRRLGPLDVATSSGGGDCMQACDPAAPSCLFCGWACNSDEGFCMPEAPPGLGPVCVADCECPRPWTHCVAPEPGARTWRCVLSGATWDGKLYCGISGANCACTGGTCELNPDWPGGGGCCRTPDGDIISSLDDPRRATVCGPPAP